MPRHIKKLLEHNAKTIAWGLTIFIAYLSLRSGGVGIKIPIKNIDKVFHFTAYFVLTTAWLFAYRNKKAVFSIIILLILYGILLEFAQEWFTDSRTKDIFDAIANTIGIVFATLVFKYLYNNMVKKFG